ncbi:S8 family serine peptidase [Streptomyces phytohabitans]|uniref:S8 family serine peptidase n=1 Tax=Streptomyces phytohabitans TaxID=1150371 RepID=UPI00345BEB95
MTVRLRQGSDLAPRRHTCYRKVSSLAITGALAVSLAGVAPNAAADSGPEQWYLKAMQAEKIWKVSRGEGITVAVVDTGVNDSTASLQGQVLPGKDLSDDPGDENDDSDGHGTTLAELIAGTGDDGGIRGLAPGAKIVPVRAGLRKRGEKLDWSKSGNIHEAIRAAAETKAQIINLSFGAPSYTPMIEDAIKYAADKGKLIFVSAGNDGNGKNERNYPASFDQVVAVSAVNESAKAADFSQHRDYVDLAAPGVNIPGWCAGNFEHYCTGEQGTSQAAALASASAALIWSKHKDWTANQVLRVMLETAGKPKDGKVPSTYLGYGVVRPNDVLLDGKGDPGDPDKNPLARKYRLESPSPTPSSTGDANHHDKGAAEKVNVAESSESDGDSNLGLIIGTGAAVAVLAGGAFAFMRMRRK